MVHVASVASVQDYIKLAQDLFLRMQNHGPTGDIFNSLGIESVAIYLADQKGNILHSFDIGTHAYGSDPGQEHSIAARAAKDTGEKLAFSSRENRLPGAGRFAGAVRGFRHILSCRLVPLSTLSGEDMRAVEDMSEIFSLAYALFLSQLLDEREMNREMALGYLSRYPSAHLSLFDPFL